MEGAPTGNPWPLASGITGLCMATLVGGGLLIVASMAPQPVKPVKSYEVFKAEDNSFACRYPAGWKKRSVAVQATDAGAYFTTGDARIAVETSLAGSLIADMPALPGAGMMEEIPNVPGASELNEGIRDAKRSPVERAHEMGKKVLTKEGFKEGDLKPIRSRFGEGRVAEITGTGGLFGGKIKGYHATFLSSERMVTVVCRCPEPNWSALKAPFVTVIQSVGPAQ